MASSLRSPFPKPSATKPADFLFGKLLGEGSYGRVFHARLKGERPRDLAVKVMDKKLVKREGKVELVKLERTILSRANHPNVIRLLASFVDDHHLFLVMDLCRGGDVLSLIRRHTRENDAAGLAHTGCPLPLVRHCMTQLVSGLQYLHTSLRVVHRDLKPENLLLDDRGNVKITDFGSAMDLAETAGRDAFVGSAEYVSPEVLREEEVDFPVDLWALGCILYQMICGILPFHGDSEYLTFQEVLGFPASTPLPFPPSFSPDAKDLVLALLKPSPWERLGSGASDSELSYDRLRAHPFLCGDMAPPAPLALFDVDAHPLYDGAVVDVDMLGDVELLDAKLGAQTDAGEGQEGGVFIPSPMLVASPQHRSSSAASTLTSEGSGFLLPPPAPPSSPWESVLQPGETIAHSGFVVKHARLLSAKRRYFILTSKPRLAYFDVASQKQKGEVEWSSSLMVTRKGEGTQWDLLTARRVYHLSCDSPGDVDAWAAAIMALLQTGFETDV